jgi:hypothetical protein
MNRITAIARTVALALMVGAPPVLAAAQAPQMSREDNIWGGKAHQPTESEVINQERLHGLAVSPRQELRANEDVENLYQSLIHSKAGTS